MEKEKETKILTSARVRPTAITEETFCRYSINLYLISDFDHLKVSLISYQAKVHSISHILKVLILIKP